MCGNCELSLVHDVDGARGCLSFATRGFLFRGGLRGLDLDIWRGFERKGKLLWRRNG